jgi:hypothetical protein
MKGAYFLSNKTDDTLITLFLSRVVVYLYIKTKFWILHMKTPTHKFLLVLAALFVTSFNVSAAVECAPEVPGLLITNATYKQLYNILQPDTAVLKTKLDAVKDQATYALLLKFSRVVATDPKLAKGRLL